MRSQAELEAAEASHLGATILVAPYVVYLAIGGMWTALAGSTLAQAFVNLYPIMHLRLARHPFERLAARRRPRRASADTGGGSGC